ncbi:hypothetical protein BDZ89DRAFT_977599, partial [Hymenopellis radicata]
MPAFDPVRDAVLNSPLSQSPLISGYPFPTSTTSTFPASPSLSSPSLSRRATDLSVLLNADDGPRPNRRSSLTHLLHPFDNDDDDDNRLASSQPLRRQDPEPDYDHRPTSSSSRFTVPSPVPDSPNQSPVFSRPSSSSSSFQQHTLTTPRSTVSPVMPPPPLPPTTIPYNPKKRLTPATSVLKPLSPAEMSSYKQYVGQGTLRLTKRKRDRSSEPDVRPTKKHAGDVGVVVNHYNSRPDVGVVQRLESPIIGLKNFNNWVKSVLISRFAHPVLHSRPSRNSHPGKGQPPSGKVLDMGCGKGGDITKWVKARVKDYVGADIAAVSVEQARQRYDSLRGPRFSARFAALDCYTQSLASAFPRDTLDQPFDVVSMQFCMHYAFETEQKVRCMLENVSNWLRPGGVFIGTIPNGELLLEHLNEIPPDATDLSFGNDVYKIRFEDRAEQPIYGHKYWFFLRDAVEDVPEYVVHWDHFVQLASSYDLYPTYKEEFHHVFGEHQEHPEFGPLMLKMKVVDENGESSMDEDQWEAANIYIAFAFQK